MAVYEYEAVDTKREEFTLTGTVVAIDELDARNKLKQLRCERVRLKRIEGVAALFKSLTADIK